MDERTFSSGWPSADVPLARSATALNSLLLCALRDYRPVASSFQPVQLQTLASNEKSPKDESGTPLTATAPIGERVSPVRTMLGRQPVRRDRTGRLQRSTRTMPGLFVPRWTPSLLRRTTTARVRQAPSSQPTTRRTGCRLPLTRAEYSMAQDKRRATFRYRMFHTNSVTEPAQGSVAILIGLRRSEVSIASGLGPSGGMLICARRSPSHTGPSPIRPCENSCDERSLAQSPATLGSPTERCPR